MKKLTIYLLVLLLMLSTLTAFAGCDKADKNDANDDEEDLVEEYNFPDVERKDYGDDFNLYVAESNGGIRLWYMDDDLNRGSALDEAVYQRQERVRKHLGVEFVRVNYSDNGYNTYWKNVQDAVQNKDGTLDALITHVHGGVSSLISENLLYNLGELEGIDVDAEYWHKDFMNTLEINGEYFLGHSDYNIMVTYVIGYNKKLLDQYGAGLEKSVYDMVRDGEWTLDAMMNLAKLVYVDETGDGKSADDTFGLTASPWIAFNGFLTSSGIPMVSVNESGKYKIALNQDVYQSKANDLVEFFRNLDNAKYTYFSYSVGTVSKNPTPVALSSGRTLMNVLSTNQLESLLDFNLEFGVLPYPLYDQNQYKSGTADLGYKSLQWGGYLGALSYMKNPALVGETLEMLSYYSENVKITYYEKVLGKRIADMPDDAEMLEIIWNGISTDFGQTFNDVGGNNSGVCYTVPQLMLPGNSQNLSSYLGSRTNKVETEFEKFLDSIEKNKSK